jgi:hypothetical protein
MGKDSSLKRLLARKILTRRIGHDFLDKARHQRVYEQYGELLKELD